MKKLTKMDMAVNIVTALYKLDSLATEDKNPVAYRHAKRLARGKKENLEYQNDLAEKIIAENDLTPPSARAIGVLAGLTRKRLAMFCEYLERRGWSPGINGISYMEEWADRFAKNLEYEYSDKEGQAILRHLYATYN